MQPRPGQLRKLLVARHANGFPPRRHPAQPSRVEDAPRERNCATQGQRKSCCERMIVAPDLLIFTLSSARTGRNLGNDLRQGAGGGARRITAVCCMANTKPW